MPGRSVISLAVLAGLLGIGGFFRFDHIAKQSLWVDEYWALYLATGRGNLIFDMPLGRVIESPPAVGFAGAPPWWHIWTGLASTPHPPLYHLALRFWVDVFGDGDFPTRAMSAVFGLGCIILIFDLVRPIRGDFAALVAAGLMTFSAVQIDLGQQTRPYTMLVFIGLVLCKSVVLIEQKGLSRFRILLLGVSALCLALTHYFSLGAIGAVALYSLLRFPGRKAQSRCFDDRCQSAAGGDRLGTDCVEDPSQLHRRTSFWSIRRIAHHRHHSSASATGRQRNVKQAYFLRLGCFGVRRPADEDA